MDAIMEICQVILPALLTGVITFLITRYTQNRSVPLDKMELAYNRIYYPLYKIMRNKKCSEINQEELQSKMNTILIKYDKYISQSTRNVYSDYIKNYKPNKPNKVCLQNFQNNILSYNSKLRFFLGYPQASAWEVYAYLDTRTKRLVNSLGCIMFIYILTIIQEFTDWDYVVYLFAICVVFLCWMFIVFVGDLLVVAIKKIFYSLKNIFLQVLRRVRNCRKVRKIDFFKCIKSNK